MKGSLTVSGHQQIFIQNTGSVRVRVEFSPAVSLTAHLQGRDQTCVWLQEDLVSLSGVHDLKQEVKRFALEALDSISMELISEHFQTYWAVYLGSVVNY